MESGIGTANLPSRQFKPRVYGVGAWTPHLHLAYDLVALVHPAIVAELGTDRGESYFAFCQSAAENKTGTRCFAIDIWCGDEHAGQYDETTFAQVTAHNRAHYEGFSNLMRCTFDAALEKFPDASIDLLHLDGLHSEEAVRRDVANWLPKLRPGALLLLHDVAVRTRDFGVWKVWEELKARGRSWTFDVGPGLGLWQNPPNESLPEPIEILFAGPEAERHELLQYYQARTSQLQETIAKEWRDGTVRDLPFLQQTVIQVFHTSDGVHREEDSVNARIGHDDWKEISIPLPRHAGANPLRIDFVSPLTIVEITLLRLTCGGKIVFEASDGEQFGQITLAGDAGRLPHPNHLRVKITGIDPQLYLPPLSIPNGEKNLVLKMRLRVKSETSCESSGAE
jgi:methyltransferase family protein